MSRDLHPAIVPEKTYQPDRWSALHRYIVMLELVGKRPGEIAEIVGLSSSRVSVILNDRRAELDRIELGGALADRLTSISSKLELYAHEALEVIVDEMRDVTNKPELRVKAGFGLLDRAGYLPGKREEEGEEVSLPDSLASRMSETLQEISTTVVSYKVVPPQPSPLKEEE